VPWGYCFKFHPGQLCTGCAFKHSCFKCQGNHRVSQCGNNFCGFNRKSPANTDHSAKSKSIINTLISGFSFGFPLHYQGEIKSIESKNLISALQYPKIVDMKLDKELTGNRLAGPFSSPPFNSFCVSPLGLVPKKTPGEFRLIHHLSFPKGVSVNDGIPSEDTSVNYATVSDAIRLINTLGRVVS
jgi:hypothetical protein